MLFTSIALSAFVITASAAPSVAARSVARDEKNYTCHSGPRILTSRGHSSSGQTTEDSLGLLRSLLTHVEGSLNNTVARRVNYPNTDAGLRYGVEFGTQVLTGMIEDYVAACPDAQIVLLGYSEGAMITMNTLCGTTSKHYGYTAPLDKKYSKNIVATVVYGDLTRAVEQPYDLGTCTTYGIARRTQPELCAPYIDRIQSYCDTGDPYCCKGGDDINVHRSYPGRYNVDATEFVTSMWDTDESSKS